MVKHDSQKGKNMATMAKENLVHGRYYEGMCRNATVARWDATRNQFYHWRTKFGHRFVEAIRHPDDEQYYDVFRVVREIEAPELPIPLPDEDNQGDGT